MEIHQNQSFPGDYQSFHWFLGRVWDPDAGARPWALGARLSRLGKARVTHIGFPGEKS